MRGRTRNRLGWVGGAALAVSVALATGALAQSQPKLPVPPPTPKGAAPAAPAAPATTAEQPPAPPAPAAGGRRDPFEPLVRKPAPGEERRMQEIASLKLVGVVWDAKDPQAIRALVETPDGLGYYLRLNEERFGGKVTALERDRVRFLVREQPPGAPARERTIELRIPSPDGQ